MALGSLTIALGACLGGCRGNPAGGGGDPGRPVSVAAAGNAASAAQILAAAQAQPGSPVLPAVASGFATAARALTPQFPAAALAGETRPATVALPQLASAAMHLLDPSSGAAVDVSLAGTLPVAGQAVGGYLVYPAALAGAAVLHRALPSGTEDFVSFPARPPTPEVDYGIALGASVAGLRLVGGTLELLDAGGAPRFHVPPPYVVGADGVRTDGALAVSDCAVDTDPSPPWGRAVTPPGASTCTVRVTWPDAAVVYPAVLDPRWTTTGSMGTARFEYTLILLSTGKALAAGGRSTTSGTTGLTSAELYDPSTGSWAATGPLAHGRRLHTATQLPTSSNGTTSGKVLVAGGISGTTSLNTAELYSPSTGTWIAAGNLDTARHQHTATLLPDGRVLAAGGLNGTTMLTGAALYNPASGAGSWVATTGPVPPGGIKNHTATLIQTTNTQLNNHVLLVGGNNGSGTVAAVYLFDPVQNAFSTLASIPSPREQATAVTLPGTNGKILVTGGKNGSSVLATAIVFDPGFSNGTWSSAGTMTTARVGHTMTLLPNSIVANGSVLVAGGSSTGSNFLSSAELFSGTATWTATPSMPGPLSGHQAVLLSRNSVLVAGGLSASTTVQTAAYLYDASFGLGCSTNSQCASGFCVSGICCDSACTGTCGACNLAGHLGACTPLASGTVCRAQNGACDVAETCNGSSTSCPSDGFAASGTTCRASTGECDPAETCSGTSAACPSDAKSASGTACTDDGNPCTLDQCNGTLAACQHPAGNAGATCRAQNGACDVAETCTGTSAACPTDAFAASGTVCRAANGVCDVAETCSGTSAACPTDAFLPTSTVCRPSTGTCDVAENCTGSSASCPADGFAANGTTCSDGNACTQTDTCQSGACVGGNPIVCVAQDQCHTAGTCNQTTGVCSNPAKPNGTTCSDGNACTQTDTCQSGTCTGGNPVTCTAQDQCHDVGTCNQSTGVCSNPTKANGTTCNDGNACTQTDTCQSGTCTGGNPVTCTASDQCHNAGTCDPANGNCSNPNKADGTNCNDGNACTQTDTCQAGTCAGGNPVTCTAQDQCHDVGTCDQATGACSNPNKANGTTCNDGNACTTADACQGGTCTGTTVTCTGADQCHTVGACVPATGCPAPVAVANGTSCDDGNSCTSGDSCQSGTCTSGQNTCVALTIVPETVGLGGGPNYIAHLSSVPATAIVPGDVVNFSVNLTYPTIFLRIIGGMQVTNNGSAPFTWGSYQVTFQYQSAVTQQWIPLARSKLDANGVPSDDPPLIHLDCTNIVGQTLAPGQQVGYEESANVVLPADLINVLSDPLQTSHVALELHVDTGAGTPGITSDRDVTEEFVGVNFDGMNVGGVVTFGNGFMPNIDVALAPANAEIHPDSTITLTGSVVSQVVSPKAPGETDDQYIRSIVGAGYEGQLHMNVDVFDRVILNMLDPVLNVQKSGPAQGTAGLTLQYPLLINNIGTADASGFSIVDTVDGTDVGAQSTVPASVAPGAAGTATINAASPVGQAPGPYTDQASITWQDRNGNVYGPISSSFTTTLAAGHPEGYLTLTGTGQKAVQVIGEPLTLTAKALDQLGNPVAGLPVQLVITGANAKTVSLVTDAGGTAVFTYNGPNLGADTATVTATINGPALTASVSGYVWASSVAQPPCTGRDTPLDVMLVIDASPSMFTDDQIEAANAATNAFLGDLDPALDQAGSIVFSGNVPLSAPLSSDLATVQSETDTAFSNQVHACDGFCPGGSDFKDAFATALAELQGPRHRPDASPVIVFLSDGGNTGDDPAAEIAAVKAAGVRVIALGYGSNVNVAEMRGVVASSPSDYFYAPSVGELSWIYGSIDQNACRTLPPIVSAGGSQGLYEVRLPATLTLAGEVHGGGPRGDVNLTSTWTEISGPAPVTFTDPSSPVTEALFTDPGTYILQLEATDGFLTTADRATITVDPAQSLSGANLALALGSPGPLVVGTPETMTATLTDATSHPIANFAVQFVVTGANPGLGSATTNASGVAMFTYAGTVPGTDVLQAIALGGTATLPSSTLSVSWTPAQPGANGVVSQGWIGSPAQRARVEGLVPVTVAADVTIASSTVSIWSVKTPGNVITLATSAAGSPGATLATLDTTTLPNGSYVIDVNGTDDHGNQQDNEILVAVAGDYKPGRVVLDVTDFTTPLAGIPITIGRHYDTLNKDKLQDFGFGWSLAISHPDLEVDQANDVTITLPNGRRSTFLFELLPAAVGPVVLQFIARPLFAPEPGTFGTLTADGCGTLVFDPTSDSINPICFDSIFDPTQTHYAPTTYRYTDAYGTVYTMGADGALKTIQDRNNNVLTFRSDGITSNFSDRVVSFVRDGAGRITQILGPNEGDFFNTRVPFGYSYDADGNLSVVEHPNFSVFEVADRYGYDGGHRLTSATDTGGQVIRTSTYDAAGRLATDTDGAGNVTHYAYDVPGHKTTTIYPDTGVTVQTFDGNGMLLSLVDQLGRTTTHEYDANRNETKRTNALGEVTTYTYDANGNQTSSKKVALNETTTTTYNAFSEPLTTTNPIGNTTTITYDGTGLPTSFVDSMGPLAAFTSTEHGLPSTVTDAAGNTVFLGYDGSGDLTSRTDRLGRVTSYGYDGAGYKRTMTDPRGGVTTYRYDYDVRPAGYANPLGFGPLEIFNPSGTVQSRRIDGSSQQVLFLYDAADHVKQTNNTDNTFTTQTTDFRGNVLTLTDELGRVTHYDYDLAGRLTKTTYPDGTFTQQSWDELGRLSTKTDERGNTVTYGYQPGCDCSDRLTSITDALGRTTSMTYDGTGRKTSMTDANNHTTSYIYDLRGHLTETDYADGTSTIDTYDALGRRTASQDQMDKITHYGYDAEGQLTSVTDPLGHVTQYGYDGNGNLTSVTDANNHVTTYGYDAANRKTSRTLPLGMTEHFAYDADGNITSHTDFRGKTATYTFDNRYPNGRPTGKIPDPSLGEPSVSYTYYTTGPRHTMTDASGLTTYTYDLRDRLLTKATPEGMLTYTYDPSGNVASIDSSNTNGTSVAYAWDAANQLSMVTDNRLGGMTTAAYTATGRPFTLSQPNGVGVTYGYDSLDRVTSMAWQKGTNPTFASWAYGYNPRGQRTSSTDVTGREAAYGYDDASRLTSETITGDPSGPSGNGALTYSIDPVGNRSSRTSTLAALDAQSFSYDSNDELTSDGYDLNGNTTSSGGHTYGYDFENRLVSKDGGAVTLVYDGDGNRVAKTAGGVTTQYLVDELNPTGYLQVIDEISGGAVQVRYTYGNMLVSQTRSASSTATTSFYGYDAHGNISFLTDLTGTETDAYVYDAWGTLIGGRGSTPNSRLYDGEEFDADLGLLNLRARQYRPETGRFLTLDPAAGLRHRPITLNRYLYASVDPLQFFDPSGASDTAFYSIRAQQAAAVTEQVIRKAVLPAIGAAILMAAISTGELDRMIDAIKGALKGVGDVNRLEWCLAKAKRFLRQELEKLPDENFTVEKVVELLEQATEVARACLEE